MRALTNLRASTHSLMSYSFAKMRLRPLRGHCLGFSRFERALYARLKSRVLLTRLCQIAHGDELAAGDLFRRSAEAGSALGLFRHGMLPAAREGAVALVSLGRELVLHRHVSFRPWR